MPAKPPTLAAVIALSTARRDRTPGSSLNRPFNRLGSLADLAALGRKLDHQVTRRGGATVAELDATLATMRAVHDRITSELGKTLGASSRQSAYRRKSRAA
ncbi:hypothetical protein P3T36_002969 [Kitasatospora sp. MAP12-15]|uniref:hypothetical protein n=1 Tax=unclassified Kitasatospora TaxID=2633591 RepID=UPI0024765F08|nr:hypothetical protein [Kitasatospora sp. MAP12-44]MDH6108837.1 hypothetical protein [Kitasatospora sp. MAP12-44]